MCFGVVWINELPKLSFLNMGSIFAFLTQNSIRLHLCAGLSSIKRTLKIVGQPLFCVLLGCRVRVSTLLNLKLF